MIEAMGLMVVGAALARLVVTPMQVAIERRQERMNEERARRLVDDINRGAPQRPDVLA